jgi:hypothetical protein
MSQVWNNKEKCFWYLESVTYLMSCIHLGLNKSVLFCSSNQISSSIDFMGSCAPHHQSNLLNPWPPAGIYTGLTTQALIRSDSISNWIDGEVPLMHQSMYLMATNVKLLNPYFLKSLFLYFTKYAFFFWSVGSPSTTKAWVKFLAQWAKSPQLWQRVAKRFSNRSKSGIKAMWWGSVYGRDSRCFSNALGWVQGPVHRPYCQWTHVC